MQLTLFFLKKKHFQYKNEFKRPFIHDNKENRNSKVPKKGKKGNKRGLYVYTSLSCTRALGIWVRVLGEIPTKFKT